MRLQASKTGLHTAYSSRAARQSPRCDSPNCTLSQNCYGAGLFVERFGVPGMGVARAGVTRHLCMLPARHARCNQNVLSASLSSTARVGQAYNMINRSQNLQGPVSSQNATGRRADSSVCSDSQWHGKSTPMGVEPLRAEPDGFRVHLLNRSDTVSCFSNSLQRYRNLRI